MNFDFNTLSMLMQLMGNSGNNSGSAASLLEKLLSGVSKNGGMSGGNMNADSMGNADGFGGNNGVGPNVASGNMGYNSASYGAGYGSGYTANSFGNNSFSGGTGNTHSAYGAPSFSPFAKQNGLGDRIDFSATKRQEQPNDPMGSLLNMFKGQGYSISDILPIIMNMRPKAATAGASSASDNSETANNNRKCERGEREENSNGERGQNVNRKENMEQEQKHTRGERDFYKHGAERDDNYRKGFDRDGPKDGKYSGERVDNACDRKARFAYCASAPAPDTKRNPFAPVAFAGYPAVCALNALYNAKTHR